MVEITPSVLAGWTTLCRERPGAYDWGCGPCDNGFGVEGQLESQIVISLMTWAADTDASPAPSNVEAGWWGDQTIGSQLYRIPQLPRKAETLGLAARYVEDALWWIVADGLSKELHVTAFYETPKVLVITVEMDIATFQAKFKNDGCLNLLKASCTPKGCR